MEELRCRISTGFAVPWVAVMILLTALGVPMIIAAWLRGETDNPPVLFGLIWIAILGWFWYDILVLVAYEVRLTASGDLVFRSVLRTTSMRANEVRSVGPWMGSWDPYTVAFRGIRKRSGFAIRQMDGFHQLIAELRRLNPGMHLRSI